MNDVHKCLLNAGDKALIIFMIVLGLMLVVAAFFSDKACADPRMETEDGFCHFQISPNDANVEVFAGVCENSIFVYDNQGTDEADGDAIWIKKYARGRTPIGNVRELVKLQNAGEQPPEPCKNQWDLASNPMPGFPLAPIENLLCLIRLTGEETGIPCNLVDSNGNTYTTQFWTAKYELFGDKRIVYSLSCRNAQEDD